MTAGRSTEVEEGSAAADLREFFLNPEHWIYRSKGTPSQINPDSVYHISQLQVLFEDGSAYGIEVKNTFPYMPDDELEIKIAMCNHLGLRPLFIARNRHAIQWDKMQEAGGLLYIFKSKILPPGHEPLRDRMWQQMRLPVAIWSDWHGQFYNTIAAFIDQ